MHNSIKYLVGIIGIGALSIYPVNLENWRMPFYRIAVEQFEVTGSPSNMFWDDLGYTVIMDSLLWPDTGKYVKNHWTLEPAFSTHISNEKFVSGKNVNIHLDALSDFRWKRLTIRTLLDVDQSSKSDPDFVWKTDRIAAGLIEEAYLQYTGEYGFARLGRLKRNWGPFYDRSILLSNNPFAYDAFEWQLHTPFLEFRHLVAVLPRYFSYLDTEVYGTQLDRYYCAHALNFIFGKWGSLGVSETVLFARQNGFPDLQLINPVSIYTVINTNGEGSANLMIGFQGWVHPFTPKITLKGQVAFDDFQVDDETVFDKEPMHWACDFGLYWVDLLPIQLNHHFSFEYRYLSKWMYTVTPRNTAVGERYTYLGRSLGYSENDGDYFKGAFTTVGKNFWTATAGVSVARKDTNTLQTKWLNDSTLGYTKEEPLSKRAHLKTTIAPFIEVHGYFRDYCDIHLCFESRWVRDKKKSTDYTYDPRISLIMSLHYSNFFVMFKKRKK